jgi:hypothetical protein
LQKCVKQVLYRAPWVGFARRGTVDSAADEAGRLPPRPASGPTGGPPA